MLLLSRHPLGLAVLALALFAGAAAADDHRPAAKRQSPPIIRSAAGGPWSASATWEGGKVPGAGARVLIGDPGRSYFPRTGLTKLTEYEVATTRELEDFEVKKTAVWEMP